MTVVDGESLLARRSAADGAAVVVLSEHGVILFLRDAVVELA
jgi:hypothetical protein